MMTDAAAPWGKAWKGVIVWDGAALFVVGECESSSAVCLYVLVTTLAQPVGLGHWWSLSLEIDACVLYVCDGGWPRGGQ